jgi:transposase
VDDQEAGKERPGAAERPPQSCAAATSVRRGRVPLRQTPTVLRLLRGENLETVSRSPGVTAATLTTWHDAFLATGEAALATRPESGEALESKRLKSKLGAVMIERDLLHEKIAVLESGRPLGRRTPARCGTGRCGSARPLCRRIPPGRQKRPRRNQPNLSWLGLLAAASAVGTGRRSAILR